jgi:hypothetical protein
MHLSHHTWVFPHSSENPLVEICLNPLLMICVIRKVNDKRSSLFSYGGGDISFEDVRALGILRDLQNRSPQTTKES